MGASRNTIRHAIKGQYGSGGDRREVVQVLLALTIISTVAAVSGALSALGLLPQRRRAQPQTVVIVMTSTEVLADEPQPTPGKSDLGKEAACAIGFPGVNRDNKGMANRVGDSVVAVRDIGGVLRERVPAGRLGTVTEAPFGGPVKVTFHDDSWWYGRREITVPVYPGEVATVR